MSTASMPSQVPLAPDPGFQRPMTSFPVNEVYEAAPAMFASPGGTTEVIWQIWRYTVAQGNEAMVHWTGQTTPSRSVAVVGPLPNVRLEVRTVSADVSKGTVTALSEPEKKAVQRPAGLSQTTGTIIRPVYGTFTPLRNLFLRQNQTLILILYWDHNGPADYIGEFWGYLHGHTWIKDQLSHTEKLLLLHKSSP